MDINGLQPPILNTIPAVPTEEPKIVKPASGFKRTLKKHGLKFLTGALMVMLLVGGAWVGVNQVQKRQVVQQQATGIDNCPAHNNGNTNPSERCGEFECINDPDDDCKWVSCGPNGGPSCANCGGKCVANEPDLACPPPYVSNGVCEQSGPPYTLERCCMLPGSPSPSPSVSPSPSPSVLPSPMGVIMWFCRTDLNSCIPTQQPYTDINACVINIGIYGQPNNGICYPNEDVCLRDCQSSLPPTISCAGLTKDVATPKLNDQVTYTCEANFSSSEQAVAYFRWKVGAGSFEEDPVAYPVSRDTHKASKIGEVYTAGDWTWQCRVCISPSAGTAPVCTQWGQAN